MCCMCLSSGDLFIFLEFALPFPIFLLLYLTLGLARNSNKANLQKNNRNLQARIEDIHFQNKLEENDKGKKVLQFVP